jgi:hypothetical protein
MDLNGNSCMKDCDESTKYVKWYEPNKFENNYNIFTSCKEIAPIVPLLTPNWKGPMPPQQVPQPSIMTLASITNKGWDWDDGQSIRIINVERCCSSTHKNILKTRKEDGLCMSMKFELKALNLELQVWYDFNPPTWMNIFIDEWFHVDECHFFMDEFHLWFGLNKAPWEKIHWPNLNACHFHFKSIVKISIYHLFVINTLKKPHWWNENYQIVHMVHKPILKYVESHVK